MRLADALLAMDRESEEAYRAQMQVLYLRGDTAAAIAVWDRCKDMLRRLYGATPSPATRQLGETILAASAAALEAAAHPRPSDTIPMTVLRPPRLVERQAPLPGRIAAWRSGPTPWRCGEAGVGKSRLLAEFACGRGGVALAAARPGDADVPDASLQRLALAAIDRFEPSRARKTFVRRPACCRASPKPGRGDDDRRRCRPTTSVASACVRCRGSWKAAPQGAAPLCSWTICSSPTRPASKP